VSLGVKSHESSSKKIELHGELGGQSTVHLTEHLVSSKNVDRVILEVKDREELCIAYNLNSCHCQFSLLVQSKHILWRKDWVLHEFHPLCSLFQLVAKEHVPQIVRGVCVILFEKFNFRLGI